MSDSESEVNKSGKRDVNLCSNLYEELTGLKAENFDEPPGEQEITNFALAPHSRSINAILGFQKNLHGNLDVTSLFKELNRQSKEIAADDSMSRSQQLLASQAMTLDTIFHSLASRASEQTNLKHYDSFLKLALKAQAQSRCTMETISKIKNPPNATFVRQANYAQGPQQVNNYGGEAPQSTQSEQSSARDETRTGKTKNEPNELLEAVDEERLDFGTKSQAGGNDQKLETVGSIDRTKNRKRKAGVKS